MLANTEASQTSATESCQPSGHQTRMPKISQIAAMMRWAHTLRMDHRLVDQPLHQCPRAAILEIINLVVLNASRLVVTRIERIEPQLAVFLIRVLVVIGPLTGWLATIDAAILSRKTPMLSHSLVRTVVTDII